MYLCHICTVLCVCLYEEGSRSLKSSNRYQVLSLENNMNTGTYFGVSAFVLIISISYFLCMIFILSVNN